MPDSHISGPENDAISSAAKSSAGDRLKDTITENEQIYTLLVSAVTQNVYEKIEEKESRSRSVFVGVSSIVLAIIVAVSGFLVNELLNARVQQKVQEFQGRSIADALFLVELASLDIDARAMSDGPGYTKEQAESITRKIERLYRSGVLATEDAKRRNGNIDRLLYSFDAAVLAFAQSARVDFILELESKAPLVAQESENSAMVITIALGDSLLQDAGMPDSWKANRLLGEEFIKFQSYSKKAQSSGYPEIHTLYKILMGFAQGSDEQVLKAMLADVDALTAEDKQNFVQRLNQIVDFRRDPGAMVKTGV